eukprot:899962_1
MSKVRYKPILLTITIIVLVIKSIIYITVKATVYPTPIQPPVSNISKIKNENIAIVISDNRNIKRSNYLYWSIPINYLYAQKHNYKFMFYKWKEKNHSVINQKYSATCSHSLLGDRTASWCKLISVFHALNNNNDIQKVIFMDSDA